MTTASPSNILRSSPFRGWLWVAIGSLILAGLLALVLVLGRLPLPPGLQPDAEFTKSCLVVHVNLALNIWLISFLVVLQSLLQPSAVPRQWNRIFLLLCCCGQGLLVASLFFNGVNPILSNYVPVLNHPVFFAGLGFFFLGVCLYFLFALVRGRGDDTTPGIPEACHTGLSFAGLTILIALLTLLLTWMKLPLALPDQSYFEMLFWGVGHVLQFAHLMGMLVGWILACKILTGRDLVGPRPAKLLFGFLFLPILSSPYLVIAGLENHFYYSGFTAMMRFGSWPVVAITIFLTLKAIFRAVSKLPTMPRTRKVYFYGLVTSICLSSLGFLLGAAIHQSNTLVPAHYHASIGAVTAIYMVLSYTALEHMSYSLKEVFRSRLSVYQPVIFGAGQLTFALGFGFAGLQGALRKTYGSEQHIRSSMESMGLVIMGLGGIGAIVGGVLFLWLVGRTLLLSRQVNNTTTKDPYHRSAITATPCGVQSI